MKPIEAIGKHQVTLLVLKDSSDEQMLELYSALSNKGIGIILSSKPAAVVMQKLEERHIGPSNILLIDCVSRKIQESENIIHISQGAGALTELSIAISKLLKLKRIDVVVLDSISSLLFYNQDVVLVRFLNCIVRELRNTDKKLVLTILEKDVRGTLASVPLFVDAVVEVP